MSDPGTISERAGGGLVGAAVRRPVATLMLTGMIVTLGLVGLSRLSVDLLPEFEFPSVTVFAPYDGVGPAEIESLVLEPLEDAVASLPGLDRMYSRAREGSGVLFLNYVQGHDLAEAMNDVRVAVERARDRLPQDLPPPSVFRFDPTQFPILFLSIAGDADLREITRAARDDIKPRLARVEGAAAIDTRGFWEREVRIELLAQKMVDLGIPIGDVERALVAENLDVAGGKVLEKGREVGLRTVATKRKPEELLDVPVSVKGGRVIRLSEIARIVDGTAELMNISRVDGRAAVRLGLRKGDGENTITVAEAGRVEAERIAADFPQLEIKPALDQSVFIKRAVNGATQAALLGGLLAIAVLLMFLRSFRATLLVAMSIPVSVMAAFFVMEQMGVTLNLMTLGGLALGVGMLVDNAVVVLEAIFSRLQSGMRGEQAALTGGRDVALAVAASTATTLIIFLPVLFLDGINRILYGQLALVVVVSLLASLLVSLTLVPTFGGRLFARGLNLSRGPLMGAVQRGYDRLIARALRQRFATVAGLLGLGLAAFSFVGQVKTELMPEPDQGEVVVNVDMPVGTPIEVTDVVARQIEDLMREVVPEHLRMSTTVGPRGWWSSSTGETCSVQVELPAAGVRPRSTEAVIGALKKKLPKIPGAHIGVRPGGGFFMLRMIRGGSGEDKLNIQVRGTELASMASFAEEVEKAVKDIPGVEDLRMPRLQGRDEIAVHVDADKAAQLGLSAQRLGTALETYVRGRRVTILKTVEEDIPVVLRLAPEDRERASQLGDLLVYAPATGEPVPVREVATFERQEGPLVIQREEGLRTMDLGASVVGRPLGPVAEEVRAAIAALEAPKGVRAILSGEASEQDEMMGKLLFGALLALLLVYMVMAAQFESLLQPLLVMGAVPYAGVGVLVLFGLGGATLNLYSFLGIVVLIGIGVNNAIVLVDTIGRMRREEALSVREAVIAGAGRRLRPILMTSLTTMLGLLPVALSQAEGSELQGPLARVVVAGLLTSTAVSLLWVPVLYDLVEGWRERRAAG